MNSQTTKVVTAGVLIGALLVSAPVAFGGDAHDTRLLFADVFPEISPVELPADTSGDTVAKEVPLTPAAQPYEPLVPPAAPMSEPVAVPAAPAPELMIGKPELAPVPRAPIAATARRQLDSLDLPMVHEEELDEFFDVRVGVGLIGLSDFDEGRVADASVRKGKVYVDEADGVRLGMMLEVHRFFRVGRSDRFGHGPFAGIVASESDVVDAVIAGWMFGMRRGDGTQSLNMSLGVFLDPDARQLADGYAEGDTAPTGGEVLYEEKPMFGLTFGFSYGF